MAAQLDRQEFAIASYFFSAVVNGMFGEKTEAELDALALDLFTPYEGDEDVSDGVAFIKEFLKEGAADR